MRPEEDYHIAASKFADFTIKLLNRLQELMQRAQETGLKNHYLPKVNQMWIGFDQLYLYSIDNYDKIPVNTYSLSNIYNYWVISTKSIFHLYSFEEVLKAQKLWLDFLVINNFSKDSNGKYQSEKFMYEIDKIEKRLASLSGNHVTENSSNMNNNRQSAPEPNKSISNNKFKLELPD
jgi:hypothetical protein